MWLTKERSISFELEEIDRLFLNEDVKERKVMILSIIGDFHSPGKSFFMNYCLRFMYANVSDFSKRFFIYNLIFCFQKYKSINFKNNPLGQKERWMGNANESLTGFQWRKLSVNGIFIWSDVFLYEFDANGTQRENCNCVDGHSRNGQR